MPEISNKTLAVLLVLAIAISIGGAVLTITQVTNLVNIIPALQGITGLGTTGRVNVSVTALAQLDVAQPSVDFGVGYITVGQTSTVLNSSAAKPSSWTESGTTWAAKDMQIANTGTVDINVSFTSGATGATMLAGTNPNFNYSAYNNITAGCKTTDGTTAIPSLQQNSTQITSATVPYNICQNLSYVSATNSVNVTITLKFEQDVQAGNKTALLTFSAVRRQ